MGRELIWAMFGEGEVEHGLAHLQCVDILWLWEIFGRLISFGAEQIAKDIQAEPK